MSKRKKIGKQPIRKLVFAFLATAVIVTLAVALYILWQEKAESEPGTPEKKLNLLTDATISCTNVEPEGDVVYVSGNCTITVSVHNLENETIRVQGISIVYDLGARRLDIPLNLTIEAGSRRTFKDEFTLQDRVLAYYGGQVYISVIVHVNYSGGYHRLLVTMLNIAT